jgi:hypothetical protein
MDTFTKCVKFIGASAAFVVATAFLSGQPRATDSAKTWLHESVEALGGKPG